MKLLEEQPVSVREMQLNQVAAIQRVEQMTVVNCFPFSPLKKTHGQKKSLVLNSSLFNVYELRYVRYLY